MPATGRQTIHSRRSNRCRRPRGSISADAWKERGENPEFFKPYKSPADFIRGQYGKRGKTADLSGFGYDFSTDQKCELFYHTCIMLYRARSGAFVASRQAGIQVGSKISSRNAAMSRLANLLGIGDLLARSATAEVTLPAKFGGGKVRGNLMEKARGQAIEDEELRNADISTGELQRQLVCLQVLDTLAGQIDRHMGNYFITAEPDARGVTRVTGVQGIDNDMAFGNIKNLSRAESKLPRFVDEEGNPALPVVDKELAMRLLAVTPDMLEFAVADIVTSDVELSALTERLKKIQAVLPQMTLLEPHEWGEASRKALVESGQRGKLQWHGGNYYWMLDAQARRRIRNAFEPYKGGRGSDPDAVIEVAERVVADRFKDKVKLQDARALPEETKAEILKSIDLDADSLNLVMEAAYGAPHVNVF